MIVENYFSFFEKKRERENTEKREDRKKRHKFSFPLSSSFRFFFTHSFSILQKRLSDQSRVSARRRKTKQFFFAERQTISSRFLSSGVDAHLLGLEAHANAGICARKKKRRNGEKVFCHTSFSLPLLSLSEFILFFSQELTRVADRLEDVDAGDEEGGDADDATEAEDDDRHLIVKFVRERMKEQHIPSARGKKRVKQKRW